MKRSKNRKYNAELLKCDEVSMNRTILLYCENDVRETCRLFRQIFFSNNMRKRHHIPMRRRGER